MRLLTVYVVNVLNCTSRVSGISIGASRIEKVAADGLQFTFPVREAPIPVPVKQELELSTYVIYNGRRRTYKSRIQLITVGQLCDADKSWPRARPLGYPDRTVDCDTLFGGPWRAARRAGGPSHISPLDQPIPRRSHNAESKVHSDMVD